MKRYYRIVRDSYAGYEAQWRPWWWPFWSECFGTNTSKTMEEAEMLAKHHRNPVLKEWFVD